jgi:hypothetical protein
VIANELWATVAGSLADLRKVDRRTNQDVLIGDVRDVQSETHVGVTRARGQASRKNVRSPSRQQGAAKQKLVAKAHVDTERPSCAVAKCALVSTEDRHYTRSHRELQALA